MARWGMPSPVFALNGKKSDSGVTNVRNAASPHWRRWLGVESRCVVPFTSFAGPDPQSDGSRPPAWFALDESRPLACFAGIWTRWTSVRKVKEGETTNDLFAFLTTEPNAEVGALHPKAMPVILTTQEEIDHWMTAPAVEALTEPLKQRVRRLKAQDYSASILVPPLVERDVMADRMNIAVSPFEGRADVERRSACGVIGLSDHLLTGAAGMERRTPEPGLLPGLDRLLVAAHPPCLVHVIVEEEPRSSERGLQLGYKPMQRRTFAKAGAWAR
jgi:putative SOS response-associated peptidase YedK